MNPLGDMFNAGRILRVWPIGKSIKTIVTGQHLPDSIDILHRDRRNFWTCMGTPGALDGTIWSAY